MTTPAHTDFDQAVPVDSQNPTPYSVSDLANLRALRDLLVMGAVPGFVVSRTTGTGPDASRPQYITWYNTTLTLGFRWNITWTGYNPTTVQPEWTNDAGASWTAIGSAQVNTFDGSNNLTVSTNSGGFFTMILENIGKLGKVIADLATHAALGVGSAHGTGSIASQSASAAALTGTSAFNGSGGVGESTPVPVTATRLRETFHDYGTLGSPYNAVFELDKYAHFALQLPASAAQAVTIAVSGTPAAGVSQTFTVELINAYRSTDGLIGWNSAFKWIGGSGKRPLDTDLEASGRNIFVFTVRDGGTRLEISHAGPGG